jgi:hypothetical protein
VAWRGVVDFLMFEWTGEMPQRQWIARRLQAEAARWQQPWKQVTCPSGGPGVVCRGKGARARACIGTLAERTGRAGFVLTPLSGELRCAGNGSRHGSGPVVWDWTTQHGGDACAVGGS